MSIDMITSNPVLAGGAALMIVGLAYVVLPALIEREDQEEIARTTERATDRLEVLTGGVLSTFRVLVLGFLSAGIMAVDQIGALLGEGPLVASNLLALGTIGILSYGGFSIPIPTSAIVTVVVLAFAFAVYRAKIAPGRTRAFVPPIVPLQGDVLVGVPIDLVRTVVAIFAGALLVYFLARRLAGGGGDPNIQYQTSSDAGTTSFLLSGVHVTALLAGTIVVITWPLVATTPAIGIALTLAVAGHYIVEKQEAVGS